MRRRVLCPHCDRRRLRNAARVFWIDADRGRAWLREEISLGCRRCLVMALVKGVSSFGRLRHATSTDASISRLVLAVLQDLLWMPGIVFLGPTKWLRAGLVDAQITYRAFLYGYELDGPREPLSEARRIDVAQALVTLLRTVAVALGPSSPAQWSMLRAHVRFLLDAEPAVFAAVDPGPRPLGPPAADEVERACEALRRDMDSRGRSLMLSMMLELVALEGPVTSRARALLADIAVECGVDPIEVERILRARPGNRPGSGPEAEPDPAWAPDRLESEDPRTVLGVSPHATPTEVRRRYLQLVYAHHPDRHAHLGRAFEDAANRRLKTINEAYRKVQTKR